MRISTTPTPRIVLFFVRQSNSRQTVESLAILSRLRVSISNGKEEKGGVQRRMKPTGGGERELRRGRQGEGTYFSHPTNFCKFNARALE